MNTVYSWKKFYNEWYIHFQAHNETNLLHGLIENDLNSLLYALHLVGYEPTHIGLFQKIFSSSPMDDTEYAIPKINMLRNLMLFGNEVKAAAQ